MSNRRLHDGVHFYIKGAQMAPKVILIEIFMGQVYNSKDGGYLPPKEQINNQNWRHFGC